MRATLLPFFFSVFGASSAPTVLPESSEVGVGRALAHDRGRTHIAVVTSVNIKAIAMAISLRYAWPALYIC